MVRNVFVQALLIAAAACVFTHTEGHLASNLAAPGALSSAATGTLLAPGGTGIGTTSSPKDAEGEPFTLLDAAAITAEALQAVKEAVLDDAVEKIIAFVKKAVDTILPDEIVDGLEKFADDLKEFGEEKLLPILEGVESSFKGVYEWITDGPLSRLLDGPASCDAKVGLLQTSDLSGLAQVGANAIGKGIEKNRPCTDDDDNVVPCTGAVTFAVGAAVGMTTKALTNKGLALQFSLGPAFHFGTAADGCEISAGGPGGGFGATTLQCDIGQCLDKIARKCRNAKNGEGAKSPCYLFTCQECVTRDTGFKPASITRSDSGFLQVNGKDVFPDLRPPKPTPEVGSSGTQVFDSITDDMLLETNETWKARSKATSQAHDLHNGKSGIMHTLRKYGDAGIGTAVCFWRDKGDPLGIGFTISFDLDIAFLSGITLEFTVDDSKPPYKHELAGMCFDILNPFDTGTASSVRGFWKDDKTSGVWNKLKTLIPNMFKSYKTDLRHSNVITHINGRRFTDDMTKGEIAKQAGIQTGKAFLSLLPKGIGFAYGKMYSFIDDDACPKKSLLQTNAGTAMSNKDSPVGKIISSYANTGKATLPFCLGSADKCNKDPVRAIYGTVELKSDPYCTGVIIPATIPQLTLGSMLYLSAGKKDSAISWMGPLKKMGIKDATLEIEAGKLGAKLSARGSPMVTTDDSNAFVAFIQKFLDQIVFEVSAQAQVQGGINFEARAGTKPIKFADGKFQLSNAKQTIGPSVFARYRYLPLGATSQDIGMTLPILVCVENCGKANERFLAFSGELYMSVEMAAGVPPSTLLNGDLKMEGWWYEMLGIPFAHLGEVWLGIGFDMKVGIFPPTRLEVGGQMCFGKKESCIRMGPNDNFIKGAAYVGISANQPADNYFMAMITEAKFSKVFAILGDTITPKFHEWAKIIPAAIMDSGLEPFHKDRCEAHKKAKAEKAVSSTVSKQSQLDPSCFAYVSVSPAASKILEFQAGPVFIGQGIGMSGRINILGYRVGLEAQISQTRFYVNVEMDQIDLKVLKIGKEIKSGKVVGNPKFLVDFNIMPPSALIEIQGAFEIPILMSSGAVTVKLNKEGFKFEAQLSILGGIIDTHVKVEWDWRLKKFEARLKPTKIMFGLVSICAATDMSACTQDAVAIFKSTPSLSFELDAGIKIPVLLTEGKALIKAKDGKFYMNLYAKLFGVFENEMTVIVSKSLFELTIRKRFDLKQAITDVGNMAKNAIDKGFEAMLKVTENIDKVENAIHWGIDKFCDTLGLRKIGIPHTNINVCEGIKAIVSGLAAGIKKILEPVIKLIRGLVKKAADLFFGALGTLLNISGEGSFRVRITNGGGLLELGDAERSAVAKDAGLELSDAELDELSLLDIAEQRRRLEDAGLVSEDEKGLPVITLCLGLELNFFGAKLNMPLESTCLTIDLEKVKNIFKTIAMEIYNYVKDNIIGKAVEWLKKQWTDWGSKAADMFKDGLDKVKKFFTDLVNMGYGRGVGVIPTCCPAGKQNQAGLCYPNCRSGYSGVGPVCWQNPCPSGWTDIGVSCTKPAPYGRGTGRSPDCPAGQENDAGLCYPKCRGGYSGVGPVCWQSCNGWGRNDGALCAKPGSYGRGAGRSPCTGCTGCTGCSWGGCSGCSGCSSCSTSRCRSHEEGWGALCYPKCRSGYHNAACCICSPNCPSGMTDIGVSCAKKSYGRGVGKVPLTCRSNEDLNGLLCYPKCRAKYHAVGCCICSPDCQMGMRDDGAFCAKKSYGRGVGRMPDCCSSKPDNDAGLCYPNCRSEYNGIGPMCWKKDPFGLLQIESSASAAVEDENTVATKKTFSEMLDHVKKTGKKLDMSALLETDAFKHYVASS